MRKLNLILVVLLLCSIWVNLQTPAIGQEITCEYPCLCVCPTPTPVPTPTPAVGTLRIAHITDMHAGAVNNNPVAIGYTLPFVHTKADILIDTGDCTEASSEAQWALYRSWINMVQCPWKAAPGNHDMTWPDWMEAKQWIWDLNGYRLIGFNVRTPDIAWLQSALQTTMPTMVFAHYPLVGYTNYDPMVLAQVISTLQAAPTLLAYVCGHQHYSEVKYVSGILQIATARGGLGTVRYMTLTNGSLIW